MGLLVSSGFPLPSWVHTRGQGKGVLTPSPQPEGPESTAIEVEDIPALLRDVARFAEAVEKLKDVVLTEGKAPFVEGVKKISLESAHTRRVQIFTAPAVRIEPGRCGGIWDSSSCAAITPPNT